MENFDKTILNVVNGILNKCESIQLASITEEGFPRICEMEKIYSENIYEIIMATSNNSQKINHFLKNNKASIGFSDENNSISLMGFIEIENIENIKEKMGNNIDPERWFEKNKNGDYYFCGLRFKLKKARLFINGKQYDYENNIIKM